MRNDPSRRAMLVSLSTAGAAAVSGLLVPGNSHAYHPTTPSRSSPRAAPAPSGPPQSEASFGAIEISDDDYVLGHADAPITIFKYASLTCPHCAAFHVNTAPDFKKRYVETGTVRYVHRDYPLDDLALAAAVLLRCDANSGERAFALLDVLYERQSQWMQAEDPMAALGRIAAVAGLSASDFETCLADEALAQRILLQRQEANEVYGVRSTPTFLVNGERYAGNLSFSQFEAIIDTLA